MDGFEQILVITLASFLALFLLLGIILLFLVLKVVKSVKHITDKAEHLVDKADSVSDIIRHAATPMAVGRALSTLSDAIFKRNSKRK